LVEEVEGMEVDEKLKGVLQWVGRGKVMVK
jgi:hypothetical protein